MSFKKLIIIITVILAALLVLAAAAFFIGRAWAIGQVTEKLERKLQEHHFSLECEAAPALSRPTCFDSMVLTGPDGNRVSVSGLCLKNPMSAMSGDLQLKASEIDGVFNKALFDAFSGDAGQKSDSAASGGNRRNIDFTVDRVRLTYGEKGRQFTWNGRKSSLSLKNGLLEAHSTATPALDIEKSPVAFRNMPELEVMAHADLREKKASAVVSANPGLEIAFAHGEYLVETMLSTIRAEFTAQDMSIAIDDILMQSPQLQDISNFSVESLAVRFSSHHPDRASLKSVQITTPALKLNLPKLLARPELSNYPLLSSLIGYWKQDAGAILGQAPKNSVRRDDVKKNRPVVKKNPIPRKTLDAIRESFDGFQKKVMALPAIDIQNGRVEIDSDDAQFSFDAISFNTAELFKNSQKFQFEFNVRNASAVFRVAYEAESPFPIIAFDIQNLDSADFLKIINMPIPDRNAGDVSLRLTASMSDEDFRLSGNVDFREFAFHHPKISPNLVEHINAGASFDATYLFASDTLDVRPVSFTSGPVTAQGFIKVSNLRSDPVIEFELGAKDIPCEDIPKAIPAGFFPTITELKLVGTTMSPKLSGKIPWKYPLTSSLKESGFEDRCYPVSVAPHYPEDLNLDKYTFSTDYTYFKDTITVGPGTKSYVPLKDIPPYVKAAMFLTEDKRFFDHGPLRIAFIERALRLNLNQRSYVYGGSTIGQQLTKNLFLNRNKNLARKLEEAFITWRLVSVVPKLRIFELYINMIEFGPDIYGIHNASKFYFDKEPKDLTPLEGAFLASLKVSPSKGGRFYKFGFEQNGRWWHKRMRYIMKVLAENGYISVAEVISAYNWTPKFEYPTSAGDFRQIWLNRYGEYLRDKSRQKKDETSEDPKP